MDIGIHVKGEADKEATERAEKEGKTIRKQVEQLSADLREGQRIIESFAALEENYDWQTIQRLLILPALEKTKKEIAHLNKELKDDPHAAGQLIYNNALVESLAVMSDFPALRKNQIAANKSLEVRIRELDKLAQKNNA